jgi:hypothetical protein
MSRVSNPISFVFLATTLVASVIGVSLQTNSARADACLEAPNASAPKGQHWYYGTDRQKARNCNPISSVLLATTRLLSGIEVSLQSSSARSGACLEAPNASAPKGQHWYYGTDRQKGHKCWFLHATIPLPHHPASWPNSHAASVAISTASTNTKPAAAQPLAPAPITNAEPAAAQVVTPTPMTNAEPATGQAVAPAATTNAESATGQAVAPAATTNAEPAAAQAVAPAPTTDVEPATGQAVAPPATTNAEPAAAQALAPAPTTNAEPAAAQAVAPASMIKAEPAAAQAVAPAPLNAEPAPGVVAPASAALLPAGAAEGVVQPAPHNDILSEKTIPASVVFFLLAGGLIMLILLVPCYESCGKRRRRISSPTF